MERFLANASKNFLAAVLITVGIFAIIFIIRPMASVCDSQIDVLKKAQMSFLFKDEYFPKSKVIKTTKFQYLRDRCKSTNDTGGCYELFQDIKILLRDISTVPQECTSSTGGVAEVKRALWETMDLLVRLAWGEKPPDSYNAKFNWLDTADVSLYCRLKESVQRLYGESAWTQFREKLMLDLPGAKALPRNQIWDMSLFSENCARYP